MAYYRCSKNNKVKLVPWSTGSDAEIKDMVDAYHSGDLSLSDIQSVWNIGDEREVRLSAMAATGVGETHAAQTVKFILLNFGGKTFTDNTECLAVVGQKNCLAETGYINDDGSNTGGWNGCDRRTWCNNVYKAAIPSDFRDLFKQFNNLSGTGGNSTSGTQNTVDYFALPAEIEVFGSKTYSVSGEGSQFKYYETTVNRIKKLGDSSSSTIWWLRSPVSGHNLSFCNVGTDARVRGKQSSYTDGLAPFGCI